LPGWGRREAMIRYNDKQKIRDLYDRTSPYYQSLWGAHIHHGYWISGEETKETAQNQLIEHVAHAAGLRPGCKILDVGCGFGGSSIYLAKKYGAEATGITISPVQVEMARKAAANEGVNAKFILMDAEEMKFEQTFDVVWSLESISHYRQKGKFFASAAQFLEAGGTLAITDWFKKGRLTEREYEKFIHPIEKGMLVELDTMEDYAALLRPNSFQVVHNEILNKNCSKSWDLGLDILKNKALWKIAAEYGSEVINFLRAFRAMRAGFASGNFIYGLVIATKI
jgi:cyclopropane fatty-acyl-phospholipid synthase-like methyltransferase